MAIDRARFDQGLTYDAYKDQMTRNRDRLEENERRVDLSKDDLAAFRALPQPVKVVVLAEDWCGDVIANLPVLGRLARDSGKLDVRIFLRDQNDDLMQRYLNKGQFKSIPVFVFFDDAFRELGHWTERPASVTEVRAKRRKDIFAAHPEFGSPDVPVDQLAEDVRLRLQAELARMRDARRRMTEAHKVKITYCADCGYEPQTLDLAKALMLEFGSRLSSIELIPWDGGTFDVSMDGELIHSMTRDGGFGDARAVKDAVRARLSG